MASVIASGFGPILLACKARIVLILSVDAAQVRIIGRDSSRVPKMTGDRDVLLRTGSFPSIQQKFDGAGRTELRISRTFDAICRTRIQLDEPNSDEVRLTGNEDITEAGEDTAEMGHIAWEESVAGCLAGFTPTDDGTDDGNALTVEDIRIFEGQQPDCDSKNGWTESSIRFEAQHDLLLGSDVIVNTVAE